MMKQLALMAIFLAVWASAASVALASDAQIVSVMQRACDWQLAHMNIRVSKRDTDNGWIRAVFYAGEMALYRRTHEEKYLQPMLDIAAANHWSPGARFRFADDQAVGQLYVELYEIKHDPAMIAPMQQRWDQIMAKPTAGHLDWWWADSLFMAPPALARLTVATGDQKYLDFMDKQWWDTADFLYDKSERLFFRDKTYFQSKEPNGQPVFWSRGNGWVLAAIARVLDYMPDDYPDRARYVHLFTELSDRIAGLQQSDGFWRMSLLDPDSTPVGESSGTGLFCYAMAWGIRHDLLSRDKYLPIVSKAWVALSGSVEPSGRMEWVQLPGSKPGVLRRDDTAEYGVGALLLAGSEVMQLGPLDSGGTQ
jgi:unsaturated rhamnogalacturonyl hydrolase